MAIKKSDAQLATKTWDRYTYGLSKGHAEYQKTARKNEDFYLGAGRHWSAEQKADLDSKELPYLEPNLIFSIINTVRGYQTQSRLDIAYKPKDDDDDTIAEILSKLAMHVLEQNEYPWTESQVFDDGIIQSRGYFDIRVEFDDNMFGEVKITDKDPLDIIPDPDAKSYDPDEWADVIETRWMSLEEIEEQYGKATRNKVERTAPTGQSDFGIGEIGETRNSFANEQVALAWTTDSAGVRRVRVLERQYWKIQLREHYMDDETGDLSPVPDGTTKREMTRHAKENGKTIIKKLSKRVRWTVTTDQLVLHNEWSPYDHFTIVPYFPYFRRGVTLGLVDNLISTQEMFNKTFSQILHVVNTTANSGWSVEENSLTNMETEDLEDFGAASGLVIEYKAGRNPPQKILPNQIPTGLDNLTDKAAQLIKLISGVSEVFQGQKGPEITGIAIQSRVQQNAIQLAAPIDNLYRTRHMVANRILELIQNFYTESRVLYITEYDDETKEPNKVPVEINQFDEDTGEFFNDTTEGKYSTVIADVPDSVTFRDSQFAQAMEMRKFGIAVPDDELIKLSSLTNRNELSKRMGGGEDTAETQLQQQQMMQELQRLTQELKKLQADTANRNVETTLKSMEIARILKEEPDLAPAAQEMLRGIGMPMEDEAEQQQQQQEEAPVLGEESPLQQEQPLGGPALPENELAPEPTEEINPEFK